MDAHNGACIRAVLSGKDHKTVLITLHNFFVTTCLDFKPRSSFASGACLLLFTTSCILEVCFSILLAFQNIPISDVLFSGFQEISTPSARVHE